MGIVSKITTKVVTKVVKDTVEPPALNAANVILDKAVKGLEQAQKGVDILAAKKKEKDDKKIAAAKAANPNYSRLYLIQERGHFKEQYRVLDEEEQVKYLVKGEMLSKKHHLHLYNASGRIELGFAKEKLIALRGPLSFDTDPKNFELFINGRSLGKMKTKASFGTPKFEFDFDDWIVEGDFLRRKYQVICGQTKIMTVKEKLGSVVYDYYVLDIADNSNELLCVLIAIVIDAAQTTKKEEKEFTKEQLKRHMDPTRTPYR